MLVKIKILEMNKFLAIVLLVMIFQSCGKETPPQVENSEPLNIPTEFSCEPYIAKNKEKNLNISILLDLSDRIDPNKYPNPAMSYADRDLGYIHSVANAFQNHVLNKKTIMLYDQIEEFFDPAPSDPKINDYAEELKFKINQSNASKELINSIPKRYDSLSDKMYKSTIQKGEYIGSDTWRFFKDKVKNYCIDECSRNILVILTDGYIYHINTKLEEGTKTSYISPQLLRNKGLNKSNWSELIEKNGYGFMPATDNLSNLEVLVIGIVNHDAENNPYGKEVIKKYWSDWLTNMGVTKFELLDDDLPSNLDKVIEKFITQN